MELRHTYTMKIISVVVLSFFIWTFGGGFDVAFAMKQGDSLSQNSGADNSVREKSPGARFQDALEDIREVLEDTSLDMHGKRSRLSALKSDIDAYDKKVRDQFRATEKRLRDAKLPDEILGRHHKFVKQYDDNLNILRRNLKSIETAASGAEFDERVKGALKLLDKVKAPKRHQPLDPDKLPHRAAEPTDKKPRLKKEEFVDELRAENEPVLIASNGPIAGLLEPDSEYMLLAAADGLPTAGDLAETVEVKFTPAIQAKAQELGNDPVAIYNWVRNNVEFVPTYGSIQGADMCLQTMQCNAFDTSSLLIALLRASNVPARYAYGTVQIPMEKVMNWAGGFTDERAALNFMASGGIPIGGLVEGGRIVVAQMEHVWVEAWVDYVPSRGAKNSAGDAWIPLDASFKQYEYTQKTDIGSSISFDSKGYINNVINSATIDEAGSSVTGIDSALIEQSLDSLKTEIKDTLTTTYAESTLGDVFGKKKVISQEFPYLLGTLPYRLMVVGARYSQVPGSLRHSVSFSVNATSILYENQPLSYSISLPELAGKSVFLGFSPATASDEAVVKSYINSEQIPAYLVNLKPELIIDGQVVSTGGAFPMGIDLNFRISAGGPVPSWNDSENNIISAGAYFSIGFSLGGSLRQKHGKYQESLKAAIEAMTNEDYHLVTREDHLGNILDGLIKSYFLELNSEYYLSAKGADVVSSVLPSFGMALRDLNVDYMWGIPSAAKAGGLSMDVDKLVTATAAKDGLSARAVDFNLKTGMASSVLEHMIPEMYLQESTDNFESISAVKALKIANDLQIPIKVLDKSNFSSLQGGMNVGADVKADMQNLVNAGKMVMSPSQEFSYGNWSGLGYIVLDTNNGSGAYMIAGLSGSEQITPDAPGITKSLSTMLLKSAMELVAAPQEYFRVLKGLKLFGTLFGPYVELVQILVEDNLSFVKLQSFAICTGGNIVIDKSVDFLLDQIIGDPFDDVAKAVACLWVKQYACAAWSMAKAITSLIIRSYIQELLKHLRDQLSQGYCSLESRRYELA